MNHETLYYMAAARRETLLAEAERARLLHTTKTSQVLRITAFPRLLQRAQNFLLPQATPECCPSH